MEQRIYNCVEEVRQVLIGIEALQAACKVECDYGGNIDLEEMAKIHSQRKLLDGIEKYIKTEIIENFDGNEVRSKIYLPYIYDDAMKTKDREIKMHSRTIAECKRQNFWLEEENIYLKLPWYKKLFK